MKDLIKVARKLDSLGLTKEASALGAIIRKIAADRVKDLKEFDDGTVSSGIISKMVLEPEWYELYKQPELEEKSFAPEELINNPDERNDWFKPREPDTSDLISSDTSERLTEGPMTEVSPSQRTLMERLWNGATRAIGKDEIVSAMSLEKKGLIMITDPGVQKWPKMWLGLELTELGKKLVAPKEPGRRPTGGPRSHTMHSGLAEKE